MLFTSFEFLVFFAVVFGLYYLPFFSKCQVPLLVAASLFFYAWHAPALLTLLAVSISINAVASFQINRQPLNRAFWWALGCMVANLLILGFFKYGALVTGMFVRAFSLPAGPDSVISLLLHLPLPIGISFYTFEGISLVADVYKRQKAASLPPVKTVQPQIVPSSPLDHFLRTSLFVTFFPHLIAGPILKASHFFPQIGRKHFRAINWTTAIEELIIGYFLKTVVADNLQNCTFWIGYPYYLTINTFTGLALLFGYSMQIFADFAGYSLIAVGLARLFGYELPNNFNFPYVSRTLSEFWRRWHISLSTWLRDYLYLPLGGNRKGNLRTYVNLMVVMVLGGLWHGAAWSYAVWGTYHGAGLALERWVLGLPWFAKKVDGPVSGWSSVGKDLVLTAYVFTFVTAGWLLFKLPNWSDVVGFATAMASNRRIPFDFSRVVPVVLLSAPVVFYHLIHYPAPQLDSLRARPAWHFFRQGALACALALIVLNRGSSTAFIYFQF